MKNLVPERITDMSEALELVESHTPARLVCFSCSMPGPIKAVLSTGQCVDTEPRSWNGLSSRPDKMGDHEAPLVRADQLVTSAF